MILAVGLGNPGAQYRATRHNAGFEAVEALRRLLGFSPFRPKIRFRSATTDGVTRNERIILALPSTFMNDSGDAVKKLAAYYHVTPECLWVFHDDLDLPSGTVRHSLNSRSAGHRGVQSIIDTLGTRQFHRLRIGVGRSNDDLPAEEFVLRKMTDREHEALAADCAKAAGTFLELVFPEDTVAQNPSRGTTHKDS